VNTRRCCAALLALACVSARAGQAAEERNLAERVNDPTEPLGSVQVRDVWAPDVGGAKGGANELQITPFVPIFPATLPFMGIVELTLPVAVTTPGPDRVTALGDLQITAGALVSQSWGRWAAGATAILPTASDAATGTGKWQAGPALAANFSGISGCSFGAIVQNPISFAGGRHRTGVDQLTVDPTATCTSQSDWFAGLADFQLTFDWHAHAVTIPLGAQLGRLVHFGRVPVSLSLELGYVVVRPDGPSPRWLFGFEVTPVVEALKLGASPATR
jgi:hypothetical protein